FKERVGRGHLGLLASLLRPEGKALLITEEEGRLMPQMGHDAPGMDERLPLLPAGFGALLQEYFAVVGVPRGWGGVSDLPSAVRPGRSYHVMGWVLTPKA